MNSLDSATGAFVAAILATKEYRTYAEELAKVKQYPDLKVQIDEFRRRNYELQSSAEIDFDKMDRFDKEYQSFRENPLVADFLAAELDLCRMMQSVNARITAELMFE